MSRPDRDAPWTDADVPPGPYFHGTMFVIEPGAEFDVSVPTQVDPTGEWGFVNNQEGSEDYRLRFWATTDPDLALHAGARYEWRLEGVSDRIYVWEVELDEPEVDVNLHSRWNTEPGQVTSVMAPSGRFVRIFREMSLSDYHEAQRPRLPSPDSHRQRPR